MRRVTMSRVLIVLFAMALMVGNLHAADPAGPDKDKLQKSVTKAIDFLKTKGQKEDGSFTGYAGIGPTALVATAMMRNGLSPDDPTVAKALKYLEKNVQPDGGVYQKGTIYRNYETCVCIMCFAEANKNDRYTKAIKNADNFIKKIQWGADGSLEKSDVAYGGAGYGKHKRPDMSNTSFMIDALKAAGTKSDDEAMKRALTFISRCQNLESEHNKTPHASKNPDGGFYYTCAAGGQSMAEEMPNGGLRSYGSMTYAGLKSMLYAGVDAKDPRAVAATKWISKNYSVKENPGLGPTGLYYYYHVFAKGLDATGQKIITDGEGKKHNWRAELIEELVSRQAENGSWVNGKNERWLEGDPNLVTAYSLLALSYCK